jgi:hypothetical protein
MTKLLLNDNDYQNAANVLHCEINVIKAVAEVESSGTGFYTCGLPKILFEAHMFHDLTKGIYDKQYPNISSPVWNKALYKGNLLEFNRLDIAKKLNETAALMSTSWGRFQIMGSNYKLCDYKTVQEFVVGMYDSEHTNY